MGAGLEVLAIDLLLWYLRGEMEQITERAEEVFHDIESHLVRTEMEQWQSSNLCRG